MCIITILVVGVHYFWLNGAVIGNLLVVGQGWLWVSLCGFDDDGMVLILLQGYFYQILTVWWQIGGRLYST